ncbi:MAG: hypothetical protein H6845_02340 [Alphaproteobacteria bacterium]|nr:MAG: hypothetical protein H6845_02340 [Alphaproteobacteria bacterium]
MDVLKSVRRFANSKFWGLLSIITLTLLSNAMLRVMKDTLLFSNNSSIEVVHFIKSCLVMPISIVFVYFYTKASLRFDAKKIIYFILSTFSIFFAIYALFIYPFRYLLQPNANVIKLLISKYAYLKWVFVIYGSWSNALFYVFSELWSSIALNLIFWQFANSINTIQEARLTYVYFGILGNVGMMVGGGLISFLFESNFYYKVPLMSLLISLIVLLIIMLYKFMFAVVDTVNLDKSNKGNFSFKSMLHIFISSKYLRNIMLIVFCYHFTSNLIEVTWKSVLHSSNSNYELYGRDLGMIYMSSGFISILLFYLPSYLIKNMSWRNMGLLVPVSLTCVASIFYFVLFNSSIFQINYKFQLSVVSLFGSIYYISNRFLKYSVFDPIKEIAYMPLTQSERLKGKTMIDVFGSKFSKAMSGYVQALFLILMPSATQTYISKYLVYIVALFMLVWIRSVLVVSKEYDKISQNQ